MNQSNTDPHIAVVTGAASGIGLATARYLARQGMQVVLADIEGARDQARDISSDGSRAVDIKADVRLEAEADAIIALAVKTFGRVDILVNCAGVARSGTVTTTSSEILDLIVDTNLKGTFHCCRAAIPAMKNGGAIVNVASEQGLIGASAMAAYCASKGGVIQLTRAMAVDHAADGIRVNCVCPGPVMTPMMEQYLDSVGDRDETLQQQAGTTLMKRLGSPEEIASVIAFLVSDGASFMTGAIVVADGGATAGK